MNLDAVRDALLADAHREANGIEAAAERDASATVAAARQEADRLVTAARVAGETEARAAAARELARVRRQAREVLLRARRAAYDRARDAARDAASALRSAPGYDALVEGLTGVAREQLGASMVTTVDDEVGGLVARAGSRTVDYRLPSIADRCLAAIGPGVDSLWR